MNRGACMAVSAALFASAGCGPPPAKGFQILAKGPATGVLNPQDIYPLRVGSYRWRVTVGDGAGSEFVRSRGPSDLYGATWCDQEAARRSEYWRLEGSGDLSMPVDVEHDDSAVTLFDPPLVIAPAQLRPGEPFTQEVSMRVMDSRHAQRLRDSGTGKSTMRYVQDVLLRTPLGKFSARHIEIEFEAELRMARALSKATLYVVPGLGPVVEERHDSVRLLKVPIRSSDQVRILVSAPGQLP